MFFYTMRKLRAPSPPINVFLYRQETCDNDDDYTIGLRNELPPGVQGCLRPEMPPNSFLRVRSCNKQTNLGVAFLVDITLCTIAIVVHNFVFYHSSYFYMVVSVNEYFVCKSLFYYVTVH